MKRLFTILLSLAITTTLAAQSVVVVEDFKPLTRIVVAQDGVENQKAASVLAEFIKLSSGAQMPIVTGKAKKGDIVVGDTAPQSVTEDGYRLQTRDGILYIAGKDKGVIYGAISLLEEYLNADYLAADVKYIDKTSRIVFPDMDVVSNPAFRYRQTQGYGFSQDPDYKLWMRVEEPKEVFAGGYWVHTFNSILPSSEFGESHPEYYSYIKGKHRPGKASQWCLSNDELFEVVVERIDSIFKANPGMDIISVSQNDSNFTYCRCEKCEAVNEYEGEPSGNYVRFMNKLAERFPDKEFSTLAYLFTMKPPKHVKPLPNVNIMLCDIDCFREVPLTDNASGQEFVKAMEGWNKISDNIFVWDYGINFDNFISPFPNFKILQPNIKLFKDNDVTMHFSQIGGTYGGDLSEMRTYVVCKLMWNPDLDADKLMRHFAQKYYGAAADYIYAYEKMLEGGLLAADGKLWIYDSPVSHKDGMLNAKSRHHYHQIFEKALAAVEGDEKLTRRVELAYLPLLYSDLEIARTEATKDVAKLKETLNKFETLVNKYDVVSLNERRNTPQEYCDLYRNRFLPSDEKSLAIGAKIIWETEPDGKYAATGERYLTDGLYGGATFTDSWTGWEGKDAAFVVDLGQSKEFTTIETDYLHKLGGWILLPRSIEYSISDNGKDFEKVAFIEFEEDQSVPVKYRAATFTSPTKLSARYVRVSIEGVKECPSWHYGVGYPCWMFIDEVTIK